MRNYHELLRARMKRAYMVSVGLDPKPSMYTVNEGESHADAVLRFCMGIVDSTRHRALMYKPNWAFFLPLTDSDGKMVGLQVLRELVDYINRVAPEIPVCVDCKVGDIDNTNDGYVTTLFDLIGADAITVHNYMGMVKGMEPFLRRAEKGVIVLDRTSNKGGREFQDGEMRVWWHKPSQIPYASEEHASDEMSEQVFLEEQALRNFSRRRMQVFEYVARRMEIWNAVSGNVYMVVGATQPEEAARLREFTQIPFLLPGIGAQGGDAMSAIEAAMDERGMGMMMHQSRGILTQEDPRQAVEDLHEQYNALRILAYLAKYMAVLTDSHFTYTSGNHGRAYVDIRETSSHTWFFRILAVLMAQRLEGADVNLVVGPETLGRTIGQFVADELDLPFLWCEMSEVDGKKVARFSEKLRVQPNSLKGKRVVIVDDLLTSGSSVIAVRELLESYGATVEVVCVAVRRTPDVVADILGVESLICLAEVEGFELFTPDECALHGPCAEREPMMASPGHGHAWLAENEGFPAHA